MNQDVVHENFLEEMSQYLSKEEIAQFLDACRHPLKKSITLHTDKIPATTFEEITKKRGRHLIPETFTKEDITYYIDRDDTSTALGNTFLHQSGCFYIQEVAASLPATQLDLSGGEIILDIAAAPGGKTSQLANALLLTGKPGIVIGNDVAGSRLKTLAHNLNKGGFYNTAITKFNGFAFGKNLPEFFDHILVDAPCSGEGTGYKSDHAMKFWRIEEINKIAGTQFQLMVSAIKALKPGGTVIYSTCTINPYENELLLSRVVEFFGDIVEVEHINLVNCETGLELEYTEGPAIDKNDVARLRPHKQQTGGFFVSKLRKTGSTKTEKNKSFHDHKLLPKNQFKMDLSKGLQRHVGKWLKETFGIELDPEKHWCVATKENVYLTSPAFVKIQPHLHCEKTGIPILKKDRLFEYRPTHYLGNILGHLATKNLLTFSDELMQRYAEGENIPLTDMPNDTESKTPYRIIQRNGLGMSTTKIVKDIYKNKFMK